MILGLVTIWVVGVMLIVIGIINMKGNISSLHWYHRQRVTEENVKPFGRLVGAGTVIIGGGLMVGGGMLAVAEWLSWLWLVISAVVLMVAGAIVGMVISFYAMFKYNGGIF